ncbi:Segregation and condensation protein A [Clostridiaceae bacterium JG1575]|nr:Segregation and condensation protein A [Clostridiaceae bacterium JG1575]
METINLRLENFEGPFDLLLKLIKVNKMEITDVSLLEITVQYMAVLRAMEELDLDIASEFFVLAATLIELKSRELLPRPKEEGKDLPTKETLLHQLKVYEYFKSRAEALGERYHPEEVVATRLPMTLEEEVTVELVIPPNWGPERFFLAYMELLDRQKEKVNTSTAIERTIPLDLYKVEDKMEELHQRLRGEGRVRFSELIFESSGKQEAIVYFLAVLELVRNFEITVHQDQGGGELILEEREREA